MTTTGVPPTHFVATPAPSSRSVGRTAITRRRVILLIASTTVLRLVLAALIGLGVDESYAVAVAGGGPGGARGPLSLSYYDHPPLAFWIAGLAGHLSDSRLVLRLPFIGIFALTTWFMYRLAATLFGERAGWYSVVVLSLVPVFSVSTGSWILPDGPLMFGEVLAAFALARLVFEPSSRPIAWWLTSAAGTGVAMLSKYHSALFVAGVLLWCLSSARPRRWLRRPEPYAAAAVALLFFVPVLIWNDHHDWVSFRFQLSRASGHMPPVASLLQNLGGQIGYLLPWIWIPMVWQLARGLRRGPTSDNERQWFLACLAVVPIVLFTAVSLRGSPGLPHWPAPGYLFLVPLVGHWLVWIEERAGARFVRRSVLLASFGLLAPMALIVSQVSTGWLMTVAPRLFRHGDPSTDLLDWRSLRPALEARGLIGNGRPVFATHWIDAAKLAYGLGPSTPVRCLGDDPRSFQFLPRPPVRDDSLIVVRSSAGGLPVGALRRSAPYLGAVLPVGVFAIERDGRPAMYVTAFLAGTVDRR